MPDKIVKQIIQEVEPLDADEPVGSAARKVLESHLPGLPAVDKDGFVGIFGEREFMSAFFPGYFNTLGSAAMVSKSIDEAIDRRINCAEEPIRKYLTTDQVLVDDEHSDTQLAELFLHHRVLIIPVATEKKVHAVVTRHDFFEALAERVVKLDEDYGD